MFVESSKQVERNSSKYKYVTGPSILVALKDANKILKKGISPVISMCKRFKEELVVNHNSKSED